MSYFVQVTGDENEEPIEIPTESDGTLLLSSVEAQFPGATGLKYRHPASRGLRGVRLHEGCLHPPDEGWKFVFVCSFPKENKRKSDDTLENSMSKTQRMEKKLQCSDLVVLGLPWTTTEKELRAYFSTFGELLMAQVKKDPKTGKSKGFGFIKFADYETQLRVLGQRHMVDGRHCDVRIPNSHGEAGTRQFNGKVFIGRLTEDISHEDLRTYFGKYGEITDVYIPKPFRGFAFITFLSPEVAQALCDEDHIVKGTSVHISNATPKGSNQQNQGRGGPGGGQGGPDNWNQQGPGGQNMNPLNMLAALTQASWGLLGNMQGGGGPNGGGGQSGGGPRFNQQGGNTGNFNQAGSGPRDNSNFGGGPAHARSPPSSQSTGASNYGGTGGSYGGSGSTGYGGSGSYEGSSSGYAGNTGYGNTGYGNTGWGSSSGSGGGAGAYNHGSGW
ncbi:unnamed protein product [Meganyctiphanes norvegica]|uniref:TAR DNA-binding protein 43 n=1 Tax=Meganyctiphanes norvegica TaxID=48144 RepID=A0AAV2QYP4_MEGNR